MAVVICEIIGIMWLILAYYWWFIFLLEDHNDKNPNDAVKKSTNTDQLVSETVDQSLQTYDEDNDGYINYGEFYRYNIFWHTCEWA